jgi:hypothetical protein
MGNLFGTTAAAAKPVEIKHVKMPEISDEQLIKTINASATHRKKLILDDDVNDIFRKALIQLDTRKPLVGKEQNLHNILSDVTSHNHKYSYAILEQFVKILKEMM